ncbi:hypothetical protein ACFL54_08545 [Planctomycetota bacterium]
MKRLLMALLCVFIATPVFADKLILNSGREFEGEVSYQNDMVILKTAAYVLTMKSDQVKEHIKYPSAAEQFEAKKQETDFRDVESIRKLISWAEVKGIDSKDLYKNILEINPQDKQAQEYIEQLQNNTASQKEDNSANNKSTGTIEENSAEERAVTENDYRAAEDQADETDIDIISLRDKQKRMRELFALLGNHDQDTRLSALSSIKAELEEEMPGIGILANKVMRHHARNRRVAAYLNALANQQRSGRRQDGIVMMGGNATASESSSSGGPFSKSRSRNFGMTNAYTSVKVIDLEEARRRQLGR